MIRQISFITQLHKIGMFEKLHATHQEIFNFKNCAYLKLLNLKLDERIKIHILNEVQIDTMEEIDKRRKQPLVIAIIQYAQEMAITDTSINHLAKIFNILCAAGYFTNAFALYKDILEQGKIVSPLQIETIRSSIAPWQAGGTTEGEVIDMSDLGWPSTSKQHCDLTAYYRQLAAQLPETPTSPKPRM